MSALEQRRHQEPARKEKLRPELELEVEAAVDEEARRGIRFVLPFLLPVLYFVSIVLGRAFDRPAVRIAVGVEVAIIVGRWALLAAASRKGVVWSGARRRAYAILFAISAWVVAGGFVAIYFAAAPALGAVHVMTLAVMSTAICAVAILSTAAKLPAYFGYVAIHLGSIAFLLQRLHHEDLTRWMPLMIGFLALALGAIAVRSNRALREKIRLGLRLRDSALRDALTGLRNRTFMWEHASHLAASVVDEWTARGGRRRMAESRSLALFLIDLDHFKLVNDAHGHDVGDEVLVAFAKVAQSAVRTPDVVSRWGGEEFLVMMEVTDRDSIAAIGERIRKRVAAHRMRAANGADVRFTCSVGACLFPFDTERPNELTWEETLVLADCALYEAKHTGRNRTVWLLPGPEKLSPQEVLGLARRGVNEAIEAGAIATEGASSSQHVVRAATSRIERGSPSARSDLPRIAR